MADDDILLARPARTKIVFDVATVLGLVSGFGLIGTAVVLGGSPSSYIDIPSILIVFGGTFAIVLTCFSVDEVLQTWRVLLKTIVFSVRDPAEAAVRTLQVAEQARRAGVLSLQSVLPTLADEPFLQKGITMVVDGTPGEEVESVLRRDLNATLQRHNRSSGVLRKAAEFSPAMGLIGTLIGLIQMLGRLDDPSTIGPSMATALIATFYGAVLANMVFMPLATKLERNSSQEALTNHLYMMGAASIGRQENPRRLEMLLNSILPPAKRVRYFD